ncbi:MAG TPA: hypothetical protein VFE47_18090 [Tepidisphaeraceae bacterium]|jgi:hypothetical protein|nr:hypothetical protein [Tepidisphaeraceae bacterium]
MSPYVFPIDGNTRDAIILTRPQWRLFNIDGRDANRATLDALAAKEAAAFLKNAANPTRLLGARGFANVAPSGLVTEVAWDQEKLLTSLRLADWYVPGDAMRENHELRKLEAGGGEGASAYPKQAETESTRTAAGEPGNTQPVLPIATAPPPVIPPPEVDIQIVGKAASSLGSPGAAGNYLINIMSGAVNGEDVTGNFKMPAKGQLPIPPPPTVYGQNLAESGMPAGFHGLDIGTTYVRGGLVGKASDGNAIYHFYAAFPLDVTVAKDGGEDGAAGSSPTQNAWTYTVTGRDGTTLGTGMLPLWSREYGPATPGTNGVISVKSGVITLLDVDDVIKPGSCS